MPSSSWKPWMRRAAAACGLLSCGWTLRALLSTARMKLRPIWPQVGPFFECRPMFDHILRLACSPPVTTNSAAR
ncbi:hypothetical protein D9M71_757070 [compost metagenome]